MAEEELQMEKSEDGGGADQAKKKGGVPKMALAGIGVVLLGGGGFLAYRSMSPEPEAAAAEVAADGAPAVAAAPIPAAPPAPAHLATAVAYPLNPVLVNLADEDKRRLARARIEIVFATDEDLAKFKDSTFAIAKAQHTALSLMRSKTSSDLEDLEGQDAFRVELTQSLAQHLNGARIIDVLLTEFIIQY